MDEKTRQEFVDKTLDTMEKFFKRAQERDKKTGGYPLNEWLSIPPLEVYLRCPANRYLNHEKVQSLDLANVSVDQDAQGQGYFAEFLKVLEEKNPYDVLYVENVLSKRLAEVLRKHGYSELREATVSEMSSFYKRFRNVELHSRGLGKIFEQMK